MTSQPLNALQKRDLTEQVETYQGYLRDSPEAMEYLVGRGLEEATIEAAKLGFVAVASQDHDGMAGRISIPYITTTGPVAVRFHKTPGMAEGIPKYKDMSGPAGKPRLYNVTSIANDPAGEVIYVCEGEFDTLIAQQIGLTAVGVSGAQKWQPHYRHLLEGYNQVIVLADRDDKPNKQTGLRPGEEMANMIQTNLKGQDVRVVFMPEGHDVNSAYLDGDKQSLLDWINGEF